MTVKKPEQVIWVPLNSKPKQSFVPDPKIKPEPFKDYLIKWHKK